MDEKDFEELVKFYLNARLDGKILTEVSPLSYIELFSYAQRLRKNFKKALLLLAEWREYQLDFDAFPASNQHILYKTEDFLEEMK